LTQTEKQPFHETFRFVTPLAIIGGFLDVYTFILHHGVFANAQTGNIVLLGVSIFSKDMLETLKYVYPIVAFILGVFVSQLIKQNRHYLNWTMMLLFIEGMVLLVVGLLPESIPDVYVTTSISFISSVQIAAFTKFRNSPYSTTMMTGNLRSFSEYLYQYIKTHDTAMKNKSLHYAVIIACFIAGIVSGAFLIQLFGAKAIFFCCLLDLALIVQLLLEKRTA